MDYCRSTGILTIFWWTTDYIDGSFRISKKSESRGPAGNWCPEVLFGALFDALWGLSLHLKPWKWVMDAVMIWQITKRTPYIVQGFWDGVLSYAHLYFIPERYCYQYPSLQKVSWDEPSRSRPLFFFEFCGFSELNLSSSELLTFPVTCVLIHLHCC